MVMYSNEFERYITHTYTCYGHNNFYKPSEHQPADGLNITHLPSYTVTFNRVFYGLIFENEQLVSY